MKKDDGSSPLGGLRLNHIGLVVGDIEAAAHSLSHLGLNKRTLPEMDPIQKVSATFVEVVPGQDVFIELLEPTSEDSPVSAYLEKGGGLHHICFEVSDIQNAGMRLEKDGYRCITGPTDCRGFDRSFGLEGTRIAFFMAPMRLLVELMEKDSPEEPSDRHQESLQIQHKAP